MWFLVGILLILYAAMLYLLWDFRQARLSSEKKLRDCEAALRKETKEHDETRGRLKGQEPPQNAQNLADKSRQRFKLRKNASDVLAELEEKHNTKERHHLDIIRNIEAIQGYQPKGEEPDASVRR